MATIKKVLTDILAQLTAVPDFKTVRLWNNQMQQMEAGTVYSFSFPACFLEVLAMPFTRIGTGVNQVDLSFRVHILHEFYDAQDGTFEQDLVVFDIRDRVINTMANFQPSGCSILNFINEGQDYEHGNVYHYTLDFNCAFVDYAGVITYTTGTATDTTISYTGQIT